MPNRDERAKAGDARRIEFRASDVRAAADQPGFDGYASTSWHVDSYGTAFAPGAWTKTLTEQSRKALVLWQHWPDQVIGRPTAMAEDDTGLRVTARITEQTTLGRDVMALLRDEVPLSLSVGFRTIHERPATDSDPLILGPDTPEWLKASLPGSVWVIDEARLYEFSVVSFPANLHAEIDAVRRDTTAQALSQTLEDLRAGRLDDAGRALVSDLVAAWQAAPESQPTPPRTEPIAPRDLLAELTVTLAEYGYPLELIA
jgi:HK97 family phage prohead protease